nr:MAG: hypothetical protein [Bacteriophage sp.]
MGGNLIINNVRVNNKIFEICKYFLKIILKIKIFIFSKIFLENVCRLKNSSYICNTEKQSDI